MIRELLLCLICVGTLGVSRGNDELSKVPDCEDTGPDDIYLDLSDMNLQRIRRRIVSSSKITCLNLAKNRIDSIASDAFDGLPELHYLNLAENPVPPNELVQTELSNLKTLILDGPLADHNNYDSVGPLADHNNYDSDGPYYEKTTWATVYSNRYDRRYHESSTKRPYVHREVSSVSMTELDKLSLQNYGENNQDQVVRWLQAFEVPNLTHLYLSGNRRLGGEFLNILSGMKNLTHLYLDGTMIDYLDGISMPNLRYLSMDGCRSRGYPHNNYNNRMVPQNMYNLEYLSLANNEIAVIDRNYFENPQNLRFLNLAGNAIDNFPSEASMNMVNLRNLTLDNNTLRSVPQICELKELHSLSLNRNNIVSVDDTSFCNLQHLSAIYLRNNHLSNIENETFGHLPALVVLDLSYNNIVSLPEYWIAPYNFIGELHLDGNKFADIDSMSLKGVNGLQSLSIGHNPIKSVPILSLMNLPNSTTIDVSREP